MTKALTCSSEWDICVLEVYRSRSSGAVSPRAHYFFTARVYAIKHTIEWKSEYLEWKSKDLEWKMEKCSWWASSHCMPKLQSWSSLHAGQHLPGCKDVGPSSEVEPTILANGDIVSAEGVVNGSFEDRKNVVFQIGTDEMGSPPSNNDQAESYQIATNCRPGEN